MRCLWAMALLLPSWAAANAALSERLQQCRVERDAERRLACYDALAAGQVSAVSVPQNRPAATESPAGAKVVAAPTPAATGVSGFGLPEAKVVAVVEAIESEIEGRFTGWRPGDRIRLRNGQLWQVTDDSSGAYDLMQPKARIEKGRFGSYFLRIEGVGPTPKVRRLQ